MNNKQELDELIKKINNIPSDITDADLIELYQKAMSVSKSSKYSADEKAYFKKRAWLEMLIMCCDGLV